MERYGVFASHDGMYVQKDGLAMGSPPVPHLANGWMSQFDQTIKDNILLGGTRSRLNDKKNQFPLMFEWAAYGI